MKEASSPRADGLLRRARGGADPSPDDEARVLSQVEQSLGLLSHGASVSGAASLTAAQRQVRPPRHAGSVSARLSLRAAGALPRVGLWAAFGLSMAAMGYGFGARNDRARLDAAAVVGRSADELRPHERSPLAPTETQLEPVVREEAATTEPPPATSAPVVPRLVKPERTPQSSTTSAHGIQKPAAPVEPAASEPEPVGLREALELLGRARAAVKLGTAGDALDWLDRLESRNPGSLLEQERLVTRTLALCALGEVTRARELREQLERLEPKSIYRGQLEASCARKR